MLLDTTKIGQYTVGMSDNGEVLIFEDFKARKDLVNFTCLPTLKIKLAHRDVILYLKDGRLRCFNDDTVKLAILDNDNDEDGLCLTLNEFNTIRETEDMSGLYYWNDGPQYIFNTPNDGLFNFGLEYVDTPINDYLTVNRMPETADLINIYNNLKTEKYKKGRVLDFSINPDMSFELKIELDDIIYFENHSKRFCKKLVITFYKGVDDTVTATIGNEEPKKEESKITDLTINEVLSDMDIADTSDTEEKVIEQSAVDDQHRIERNEERIGLIVEHTSLSEPGISTEIMSDIKPLHKVLNKSTDKEPEFLDTSGNKDVTNSKSILEEKFSKKGNNNV